MAKAAPDPEDRSLRGRLRTFRTAFTFTAARDRRFIPYAIAAFLLPLIAGTLLVTFLGGFLWLVTGLLGSIVAVLGVLSARLSKATVVEAKRTPGGAAAIVQNMRGDWRVTPGVAATTQGDFVHLVLGKPGVILLGEGNAHRIRGLLGQEKKRLSKVIGSADLHDYIVGEDDLPMEKLRTTLMRLPRTLTGKEVNALDLRLKALTARPQMPKGAIPKNMRPPGIRMPRR
jgi:Domain of unknown function (DUF4191)